jgi:OB-fold nucleic acid binding domain
MTTAMHRYRSHSCGELSEALVGASVRLSGWVVNVRHIGKLGFVRIRDSGGGIQVVAEGAELVEACRRLKPGWAVTVDGDLVRRPAESIRADDATGEVELSLRRFAVIAKAPKMLDETAAIVGSARLEEAARDTVRQAGFKNAGTQTEDRLSAYLLRQERVYRVRTARVAESEGQGGGRVASVLELELAFAGLEDLVNVVRGLYEALQPLLPWAGPLHVSSAGGDGLPTTRYSTLLLTGIPVAGHATFGGRDLCLTVLARASLDSADRAECIVLIVRGRVVGAGSVLTDDLDQALRAIEELNPLDPLTSYELDDALAAGSNSVPGRAWFVLDLARLWDAGSRAARAKGGAELLRRDLSAVVRLANSHPLGPSSTPAGIAAAARRFEQWDVDAYAAMVRSRSASIPTFADEVLADLNVVLPDFAMEPGLCEALLELDPLARARLSGWPPGERFQWLWSILGNEHVRTALKQAPSYETIRTAIELSVITDLKQLPYLDVAGLAALSAILHEQAASSPTARVLRQTLALSPASFTSLLAALDSSEGPRAVGESDAGPMVEAARCWLCAPGLLQLALRAARGSGRMHALVHAIGDISPQVLRNAPVDPRTLIESFATAVRERVPALTPVPDEPEGDLASAIVQHVFRPVSLTYSGAQNALIQLEDRCDDIVRAGLATGGRHWSAPDQCFVFDDPPGGSNTMRMYLSKNTPSFLAKASVGVCTSRDIDLWTRPDHVHLNVVDPSAGIVIGNVQLHVLERESRRILLVRAMNATTSYLTAAKARSFVEGAIVACLEIGVTSEIDEVHLCEGLSFWHLNSSRPEIRAVLEPLYLELAPVVLEPPFFLFRFGGVELEITKSYRLWERDCRSGPRFPLRRFLELVA